MKPASAFLVFSNVTVDQIGNIIIFIFFGFKECIVISDDAIIIKLDIIRDNRLVIIRHIHIFQWNHDSRGSDRICLYLVICCSSACPSPA